MWLTSSARHGTYVQCHAVPLLSSSDRSMAFLQAWQEELPDRTTFLLCILFLRVFVHSRPLMTAKSGHLGPPPSNSFGRLRGGDCTKGNEAWLHITKTVRMLTDGCLFVAVGYLLHKVSFGHAGFFWTCWFLLLFHPTLDGLLRKIRPGYEMMGYERYMM